MTVAQSEPLRLIDDQAQIRYTSEATLRDGLARLAFLAGWDVETEHHIEGWGRPDLYLRGPDDCTVAVEVKLDLTRAATTRKAFQQADVYAKALGPGVSVILTAPVVDRAVAEKFDLAFSDVWFLDTDHFVGWLHAASRGMHDRHLVAWQRQRDIARDLDLSTAVLRRLSDHAGSSVGFIPADEPPAGFDLPAVMEAFFGGERA